MNRTITQTIRHTTKRLLSLLLVLALLCTALPTLSILARAEDEPVYSGSCGQDLYWAFDPETGTLSITGSGTTMNNYGTFYVGDGEWDYKDFPAPWAPLANSITKLVLPKTLTSIGDEAFKNCVNLSELSLPSKLTRIGNRAFKGCSALHSVTIPKQVTTVGHFAFQDCSGLKQLVFLGNSAYVSTMEKMHGRYGDSTPEDLVYEGTGLNMLGPNQQTVLYGWGHPSDKDYHMLYEDEEYGDYYYFEFDVREDMAIVYYAMQCGYCFYALDSFEDVKPTAYYAVPVAWACGKGITTGTGDGRFRPNKDCTRAEVVTFLYAAAGCPEISSAENPFTDVKKKDWFYQAAVWAKEAGITGGTGDGKFQPNKVCTRAEVVTFLYAWAGRPEIESTENPFTDVKKKDYFYKAVLWAVENGITGGTGDGTTFEPKKSCTRGEIVTFLYKAMN